MEIVTPHNCKINVTIIDPEQEVYDVFGTAYNVSQDDKWFDFPFGTAIAGNYTFIFSVEAERNLNILLKVSYDNSEDGKCLYDVLTPQDRANLNYYNVTKFHDQQTLEDQVYLRTDYCHKFYIGRVSTIAENLPSYMWGVEADYDIDDPGSIPFIIYVNKSLPGVGSVAIFSFGTAVEGYYRIKIVIHCQVDVVNIAYAIVESHRLSTEDECNCTIPDPEDPDPDPGDPGPTNGTQPQNYYYVPIEWTLGFVVGAVVVVGALIVIGISRMKRKSVDLN